MKWLAASLFLALGFGLAERRGGPGKVPRMSPNVHAFDPIFNAVSASTGVPAGFLRAIASRESGGIPTIAAGHSANPNAARGLMQITGTVRNGYNQRYGKAVTPDQLFDPATNVAIGADLVRFVAKAYAASGLPGLAIDWSDRRWVELVSYGYGAGWSAGSGVLYVAKELVRRGIPVSVDSVAALAPSLPGAYSALYAPGKAEWCKGTAGLFFGVAPGVGV